MDRTSLALLHDGYVNRAKEGAGVITYSMNGGILWGVLSGTFFRGSFMHVVIRLVCESPRLIDCGDFILSVGSFSRVHVVFVAAASTRRGWRYGRHLEINQ